MRVLCLFLLLSGPAALAQAGPPPLSPVSTLAPVTIDTATATTHILTHVEPVYPPIAIAAHVSGAVTLQLSIDSSGRVTDLKTVSGPPMLVGAAQEAVRQWTYSPFMVNDQPVPVTTIVNIPFTLHVDAEDQKLARQYYPLFNQCIKALTANTDPAAEADICVKAAIQAQLFAPDQRFIERRSAFVYAATALSRNKQFDEALSYANRAVDVVKLGHDDGSGSSSVYSIRAQAEMHLNHLAAADADLNLAEDFERSAIQNMIPRAPDLVRQRYIPTLKSLLNAHAQVLTALGNPAAAQAKLDEAAKL
jgi:TonB family protein